MSFELISGAVLGVTAEEARSEVPRKENKDI